MSEERTKSQAIRIEEARDGQRPVLLHPGDDDVFVRTGKQVIEACRLGISIELWLNEFSSMLEHAQRWAQAHAQRVRACFAAPRSARVALYFVPTSDQFDFDLAEELSDLNAALVQQFNIGMVEVHQIPWGDVERFIDLRTARQIHGPRHPAAHQPVEA